MKKIIFFLFCIGIIAFSASTVMHLISNRDVAVTEKDTANYGGGFDVKEAGEKIINVPAISQYPELPTGCESVATTMILQYYGDNITAEEFAGSWLECSEAFYKSNGKLYGPDPNEVFAGNPFKESSYGCFADPIVNAINNHSQNFTAQKITEKTLAELCEEYIDNNEPLLIWATMSMKESGVGTKWYLEDGSVFSWIKGEHCLVLVGYNDDYYYLNDPMSGSVVAYQKNIVESRFSELGQQAICITRR